MILFPLIVVAIVAAVAIGIRQMKDAREAWARAAASLGMATRGEGAFGKPVIWGAVGGFEAEIDTYTQKSGNSSSTYTRYRLGYPSLRLGLELKPQHALHRITRLFGAQDVEIGDTAFDDAFVVKANDVAGATALLTPGTRSALLRLFASHRGTTVEDDLITIVTSGLERDEGTLVSTIRRAAGLARRLTELDDPPAVDTLLGRRLDGHLGDAASDIGAVVRPHPDDLDGRLLEMETLATAGRHREATEALRELETVLPSDPELIGWREYLDTPASPQPAPNPLEGTEDDEFFESLFGGQSMSYETTPLFERRYAGRPVRWEGRVKKARRYDRDRDFGPAPGVKAVVTVATIEHDLYGQTEIDAVVQLPSTARLDVGDVVRFSGLLMRVDPLMRNVYVTGGRLL